MKVSDIPPTTLRLPPWMREVLESAARDNRRSLSQEVVSRLESSLAQPLRLTPDGQTRAPDLVMDTPKGRVVAEVKYSSSAGATLTEAERHLLALFNGFSPEKQLALLTFLKR